MKDILIKPTTSDDIPALRAVVNETELFPGDMLPEMLSPFLGGDGEAVWLTALLDDKAVGLCFAVPEALTNGTWNMLALAVLPEHQGDGVGGALVKSLEDDLRSQGVRVLIADTSGTEAFALTRQFYVRCGYEKEARIRDFWDAGDDKVVFRKALA
ncbi:GNAT family N-acetyltransferase [Sulfitobacter sp. D35]|uniref:GNAT family N-acetyltransferase n=1 Tax=Sulfitobacter sp. D35 TaxID=3083252 RepID=UPI00296EB016|nr:GNAT family N-acetyltransferase [Sulfitobacter sp. D35]MDW4497918.1 GNAT family N-acetyltransferase [Sulfitobacter sp. D35]